MLKNSKEIQHDTDLYHERPPENVLYRTTRRGESNSLRKGTTKIHRRYKPLFEKEAPQGIARKVFACISHHDWNRNPSLIALRQKGYTPFSRQFDEEFTPQPRRLGVRSESREALTALHFALAANCDFNPDSKYPFEVMVPFEEIARQMGVFHRYENGRVAYDSACHALRVTEEMKQLYVVREFDRDSRQYKPMRIFLHTSFFTSKGIPLDELRMLLTRFQAWTRKRGLSQTLKQRNERHLLRLERLDLGIERRHSLKKLLKRIKWEITSPELIDEKNKAIDILESNIESKSAVVPIKAGNPKSQWFAWVSSGSVPTYATKAIEAEVRRENPQLEQTDEDRYYRLLLDRAGISQQ